MNTCWGYLIFSQLLLEVMPEVFNGIEVSRLRRPHHNLHTTVSKPIHGQLALVFRVIILLEDNIPWLLLVILEGFLQFIFQNAYIELGISSHQSWSHSQLP